MQGQTGREGEAGEGTGNGRGRTSAMDRLPPTSTEEAVGSAVASFASSAASAGASRPARACAAAAAGTPRQCSVVVSAQPVNHSFPISPDDGTGLKHTRAVQAGESRAPRRAPESPTLSASSPPPPSTRSPCTGRTQRQAPSARRQRPTREGARGLAAAAAAASAPTGSLLRPGSNGRRPAGDVTVSAQTISAHSAGEGAPTQRERQGTTATAGLQPRRQRSGAGLP
jgi:hypothetical protein